MSSQTTEKKVLTKAVSIILILCTIFSFSACNNNAVEPNAVRTVTDCMNRTVVIPEDPQRVVCMYATIAHMMSMLDKQDKIVGTPGGIKREIIMQRKRPDIIDVAEPYQSGSVNAEELVRCNTDLVLLQKNTAINKKETEKLDKLGIPYVVVDYTNIEELKKAITLMGEIFNESDKAAEYLSFFDSTIDFVQNSLSDITPESERSIYHAVNEAVKTDVAGGICAEIFRLAHAEDVSIGKPLKENTDKSANASLEEIYKWNPEVILCNDYNVTEYILSDDKWSGIQAVQNGEVYTLPVGATRWAHTGSMEAHMGVLSVAYTLYPECFKGFDFKSYIKDYYSKYFNLNLKDDEVEMILAGNGMRLPK